MEKNEQTISDVARLMKYYRQSKKMSQEDLSTAAGINLSTIKKYEVGLRNPKYEQLERIADALGISVNNFYNTDIDTVGDLITIIKTLDDKTDMKITADKDENGEYLANTISISFNNKKINKALLEYMKCDKTSNDAFLTLLSSDEKLK